MDSYLLKIKKKMKNETEMPQQLFLKASRNL